MNLKAASVAWEIAMEHNQVLKALIPVVYPDDAAEPSVEKQRAFRLLYGIVMRVIDQPESEIPENTKVWISQMLDAALPDPSRTFFSLRDVISYLSSVEEARYGKSDAEYGTRENKS